VRTRQDPRPARFFAFMQLPSSLPARPQQSSVPTSSSQNNSSTAPSHASYAQSSLYLTHSSHYAQAYAQQLVPTQAPFIVSSPIQNYDFQQNQFVGSSSQPVRHGSWFQPGNNRCTAQGCQFTGSAKSVETHMMDRHLIYPPGWKERNGSDWDADPSLKGCVQIP